MEQEYNIEDILVHYGTPRHSGRYPYGSGEDPHQHSGDFLSRVDDMRKSKFKFTDDDGKEWTGDTAIAKSMGITTSQFRVQLSMANEARRSAELARAKKLREKGYSLQEVANMMGYSNDSSIRSLLNQDTEARMKLARQTADFLKNKVNEKGMIDVGAGVETELGITKEKMNQALYMCQMEGYPVYGGRVPQATNKGQQTTLKVLCPPGTQHKEIYDYEKVHSVKDYYSHDDGETFQTMKYPASMDSKRLKIRYAEDGGKEKDGVIEIRRNVKDLDLGNSTYAQVRILVDGSRYLKGMAVYSDGTDMPDGVDVIFNTNKTKKVPKMEVLKEAKHDDPNNPFGSLIKAKGQSEYIGDDGKKHLSLINKRAEEGDWSDWKDGLPSQFIAKQNRSLIKRQLSLSEMDKVAEYNEIMALTNPTVKKAMLKSFSDDCDSAAVHLQVASLPRQQWHVILPIPTMKDNEIYAPNYKDGEQVALVRYPHGGTFEIPKLIVNNKQKEAIKVMGKNPNDAVGINSKVADRLSGADFDGDTVMVIPTNDKIKISSRDELAGLKGFDPKMSYPERKGMKVMKNTQTEMGKISNLITDMTILGATDDELARAVRHSMVVIDAEKHHLDYKQSEADNGISALKHKYQGRIENGRYKEGAATLISRAKSQVSITKRRGSPQIDPETGKLIWKEVEDPYFVGKDGTVKKRTQKSTQMAETDDARKLSTGHPTEELYADYANKMKALANESRKAILTAGNIKYSPSAKETYSKEVKSLNEQLEASLKNAPRERQAQTLANSKIEAIKKSNPDLNNEEIRKISQQCLTSARVQVGAKRTVIKITDKEWEAIQAGAISENKLTQIINHTDPDRLRELATPRSYKTISAAKENKIKSMKASGMYSTAEIAAAVGMSSTTVKKYLAGGGK